MIVVSGVPRSGTSLCMDIQRAAHGDEFILGEKFPQERENKIPEHLKSFKDFYNRMSKKEEKSYEEMNPEGFWECPFTVRGIRYLPHMRQVINSIKNGEKKICKVVCSGLNASDPDYITKILFTIRHPFDVSKSQLDLKSNLPYPKEKTPKMFITNLVQASKFFLENPGIPLLMYNYDDLIEDPDSILKQMQEFLPDGDYSKSKGIVKSELRRSKTFEDTHRLMPDALKVYELFSEHKFQEVLDYIKDPKLEVNKDNRSWFCVRRNKNTNYHICKLCMESKETTRNFIKHAEKTKIDWKSLPCVFECGFDVHRDEYLTIEESIERNHWIDDRLYDVEEQERILERMRRSGAKPCEVSNQEKWLRSLRS